MLLNHTQTQSHEHTHLLRKMLLTSSWLMGGFLELAAILRGLRKQFTRMQSWWTYLWSHTDKQRNTLTFQLIKSEFAQGAQLSLVIFWGEYFCIKRPLLLIHLVLLFCFFLLSAVTSEATIKSYHILSIVSYLQQVPPVRNKRFPVMSHKLRCILKTVCVQI